MAPGLPAGGKPPPDRDPDAWQVNLSPYYWRPSTEFRLRQGGLDYTADEPFLDDLWSFKPSVVGTKFSATRKSWGLMMQGETLDSDYDVTLDDGRPGELELQSQRISLGVSYEWQRPFGDGARVSLIPWAGLRYRHATLKLLDVDPPEDHTGLEYSDGKAVLRSGSEHRSEPVLGLRAHWAVNPKWSIILSGDLDGVLEEQIGWNAAGWLRFHLSREFYFTLGYRHSDFLFDQETDSNGWAMEGVAKGLMIGIEVDFDSNNQAQMINPEIVTGRPDLEYAPWAERAPDRRSTPSTNSPNSATIRLIEQLREGTELINRSVDAGVGYVDTRWLADKEDALERQKARVAVSIHAKATETAQGGGEFEVKPSVRAKLDMPNLARGLKLAITSAPVDEKPGTDPFDRESGLNVGIETSGLRLKRTKLSLGVRSSLDPYASIAWTPEWRGKRWVLAPTVRTYYRTDKGAGAIASLGITYWIKDQFRAHFLPALEYGEDTDLNVEWLQNLTLAYLFEGTDQEKHRALMSRFSARGDIDDKPKRYRWTPIRYRAPVHERWLYWEIGPELSWSRDERWEPEASLRVSLLSVF